MERAQGASQFKARGGARDKGSLAMAFGIHYARKVTRAAAVSRRVPSSPALRAPFHLLREKTFWTFSCGQRRGDVRRLVRWYRRTPEHSFPQGEHDRGGIDGPDVNPPVRQDEIHNPSFRAAPTAPHEPPLRVARRVNPPGLTVPIA